MAGSSGDRSIPTPYAFFFLLIHSQEATIWSTDTAFTLQNYFQSLPLKPHYRYSSIICYGTLSHQFLKLPLKRMCAKNLIRSGGEIQDMCTPLHTDFSGRRITEL